MTSSISQTVKNAFLDKSITKLQHDVYMVLLTIPEGKVTTYGEIAKKVKCNSPRAIGQALRKNPFAPEVPCHRVVKANFTLGGFSGSTGNETVEKKMKILQKEGVKFDALKGAQWSEAKVGKENIWDEILNLSSC